MRVPDRRALFAILIGLGIAAISPLATVGAEFCAHKDSLQVVGGVFFGIAMIASLPGFFVGWLVVNVFHSKGYIFPLVLVYLANWLVYSLFFYWILRGRAVKVDI